MNVFAQVRFVGHFYARRPTASTRPEFFQFMF
jgi:hypothetical protein